MFRYNAAGAQTIDRYGMANQLRADNRWVKLAALIPWDELAEIYRRSFHDRLGAPSVDARIVIGALIIKHKLKLDDRGTIEMIQENPYMQYFLGLPKFQFEPVFSPSLFVVIRKRLGAAAFDELTDALLKQAGEGRAPQDEGDPPPSDAAGGGTAAEPNGEGSDHQGILKLDATVCDQYIKYPTDLDLVARARWESERLIDILCKVLNIKVKPRTYRLKARGQYRLAAKNKKLSKRKRHTAIGQQLRYLKRNLAHLDHLLDRCAGIPFGRRDYKIFLVIQHVYTQQETMWRQRVNRCEHRIVSLYQPHVRPIVRGKAGRSVEFGAKISISLAQAIARLDSLRWEAYNENQLLPEQVAAYRAVEGHWPETVVVDQLYGTRANRQWCKDRGIHLQVKPLGRPPAVAVAGKTNLIHRNDLEGKFGEGKNGFNLNKIRAKLQATSESWIAAIFFVMNLQALARRASAIVGLFLLTWCQLIQLFSPPSPRWAAATHSTSRSSTRPRCVRRSKTQAS
jgi:IS5 family transposase